MAEEQDGKFLQNRLQQTSASDRSLSETYRCTTIPRKSVLHSSKSLLQFLRQNTNATRKEKASFLENVSSSTNDGNPFNVLVPPLSRICVQSKNQAWFQ